MAADVTIWLNEVGSVEHEDRFNTIELRAKEGNRHLTIHCHHTDSEEKETVPVLDELIKALHHMKQVALSRDNA